MAEAPEQEGTAAGSELASAEEALGWEGFRVDDIGGASVGKVEGTYVDSDSQDPTWLLVRLGRFGARSAVPFGHAVAAAERVWLPYDRGTIRGAPRVDPGDDLARELELELCAYFGIPEGHGRAAQVAGRPEGSATARRMRAE